MKRLLAIVTGATLIAAGSHTVAASAAQDTKPKHEKAAGAQTERAQRASGVVTHVSGTSLTVKTPTGEVVYTIDAKTKVIGRGAGTKSRQKKDAGEAAVISDFVGTGGRVEVTYETQGIKYAGTVRVTRKGS
jgi:hypothetical protein